MPSPWRHRFAVLLSVCTLVLLIAGGVVSSREAGLAIPDWPLAYGKLVPAVKTSQVELVFEHRIVAAAVGLLTLLLAIWISRADPRPWLRRFGWITFLVVLVQEG